MKCWKGHQALFEWSLLSANKAWLQISGEPMVPALLLPRELHRLQHPGTVWGGYKISHSGKVTRSSVIPELVRKLNLIGNKRKMQPLSTSCLWSALQFLLHWNQIIKQTKNSFHFVWTFSYEVNNIYLLAFWTIEIISNEIGSDKSRKLVEEIALYRWTKSLNT